MSFFSSVTSFFDEEEEPLSPTAAKSNIATRTATTPQADGGSFWGLSNALGSTLSTITASGQEFLDSLKEENQDVIEAVAAALPVQSADADDGTAPHNKFDDVYHRDMLSDIAMVAPEPDADDRVDEHTEEAIHEVESRIGYALGDITSTLASVASVSGNVFNSTLSFFEEDESVASPTADDSESIMRAAKLRAKLVALQASSITFVMDPADALSFKAFCDDFNLDAMRPSIDALMASSVSVSSFHQDLVPDQVAERMFWARYFFRVCEAQLENQKRQELFDAHLNADEEPLTWDDGFDSIVETQADNVVVVQAVEPTDTPVQEDTPVQVEAPAIVEASSPDASVDPLIQPVANNAVESSPNTVCEPAVATAEPAVMPTIVSSSDLSIISSISPSLIESNASSPSYQASEFTAPLVNSDHFETFQTPLAQSPALDWEMLRSAAAESTVDANAVIASTSATAAVAVPAELPASAPLVTPAVQASVVKPAEESKSHTAVISPIPVSSAKADDWSEWE